MLGLGLSLTSLAARRGGGAAFGAGTPAGILLGSETSGLAIDFAQQSALIRDPIRQVELIDGNWLLSTTGGTAETDYDAGVITLTGDGTNSAIAEEAFPTVVGVLYSLTYTVATSTVGVLVGTTQGGSDLTTDTSGTGTKTITFRATTTTSWVRYFKSAAATTTVSAISLRHINTQFLGTPTDLLTYTSPSPKLVYGSDGVLRYAPHNLAVYSEDQDSAFVSKNNISVGDVITAPNGIVCEKIIEGVTESAAAHWGTRTSIPVLPGEKYLHVVVAKASELGRFQVFGSGNMSGGAGYNLEAGTVVTGTGTIDNIGNGFYRCACILTAESSSTANIYSVQLIKDGTSVYVGDGASGLYIGGVQISRYPVHSGYLKTTSAARYAIPLDHDPLTGDPLGVLIEEQRTNLLTRSQEFDDAANAKVRATITANALTAPDGTVTADKLVEDTTAGNSHVLNRIMTHSAPIGVYTYTVYAKKGGRNNLIVKLMEDPAGTIRTYSVNFNLDTGTVVETYGTGSPTGTGHSIEGIGQGWYRCRVTQSVTSITRFDVQRQLWTGDSIPDNPTYDGDGASGVYLWGEQLEAGAFPTSYIPTAGSQVTRADDNPTLLTSAFPWSAISGTLVAVGRWGGLDAATAAFCALDDGTSTEEYRLFANNSAKSAQLTIVDEGSTLVDLSGLGTQNAGDRVKFAAAWQENDAAAISTGGGGLNTDTSVTLPTVTILRVGRRRNGGHLNGHLEALVYIPRRATNEELQAFTA